jgi:hypothetical protein
MHDGNLKDLSGDAIRLYMVLAFKFYRNRDRPFLLGDWEIVKNLGIDKTRLPFVRAELKRAKLIDYRVIDKIRSEYQIVHDVDLHSTKYTLEPSEECHAPGS